MQEEDLVRLLHSLCLQKFKLLNKDPDNKVINKNDKFRCACATACPPRAYCARLGALKHLPAGTASRSPDCLA